MQTDAVEDLVKEICDFLRVSFVVVDVVEIRRAKVTPICPVLRYATPVNSKFGAVIRIMVER